MANLIARSADAAEQITGLGLSPENELTQQGRELAYRPKFAQADQTSDPAPLAGTTAFAQSESPTGTDSSNTSCGNGQKVNPLTGSEAHTVEQEKKYDFAQLKQWYMDQEDRRIAVWLNSPANAGAVAQMDQDIARLQQYAPNAPELGLLRQIRALRSNELATSAK